MRLLTFLQDGQERVGALSRDEKRILCLRRAENHYGGGFIPPAMLDIVIQNEKTVPAITRVIEKAESDPSCPAFLPRGEVKILAPYKNPPRNILCVGLNYYAHALEFEHTNDPSKAVPKFPIFFTKPFTAITDPDIPVDGHAKETSCYDYETELAVIIGKTGKDIPKEKAYEYVFGYSIINDLSARDLQKRTSQWYSGKCLDESAPFGPYIVHKDSVGNPQNLDLVCAINGEERQKSNTSLMIFDIPTLISAFSSGTTLLAGDIIITGTCPGVGLGFDPPKFLKKGDVMEMTIQGLGTLRNTIR
ncbi:MAG: fumarylacetoacetate hydrolase family protein [Desulfovibrionaceae bacterium]|nr:fumarylacetoacetate hydrolase family protein [Desulfovibrionaceae bacterium]